MTFSSGSGGTERIRIDSSGDVGIGTSLPASTLEIAKADQTNGATLSITNSFNGGSWELADTVGTLDFRVSDISTTQKVRGQIKVFEDKGAGTTYPSYNAMSFSTGSANSLTEKMVITSDGLVGIGCTPVTTLDVAGAGAEIAIRDRRNISWTVGDTVASLGFYSNDTSGSSGSTPNLARGAIDLVATSTFGSTHDMVFKTRGDVTTSAVERVRITSGGHVIIPAGITLGTATGVSSAANTLDDYEEGTWTPTIVGSTSGSITGFTVSDATYTKIGDTVRLSCYLSSINMTTSTVSGQIKIGGVPFSSDSFADVAAVTQCTMFAFDESTTSVSGYLSGSDALLRKGSSTSAITDADESSSSSAQIMLSVTYKVA